MEITFWGVRGSIASPGPDTIGVGGNTSCVEVRCGSQTIILDAGTGIRRLGDKLMGEGAVEATLLLSHLHWDHIQGIPFFGPAYVPSSRLQIVGGTNGVMPLRDALAHQMTAPVFPVRLDELRAKIDWREVKPAESFEVGDVEVRVAKQNHPGGSYAYRLDYKGRSVVYATDTEHYACVDPALYALAKDADVLIYDSQYTPEEYRGSSAGNSKVGWGHSTYVAGVELARAADVGQYVLFHHDPRRDDAAVEEIERKTRELYPHSVAAREGLKIDRLAVAQAA
jgi:phosphoribosyl 1,2-cyclic phosphodiesterase